MALSKIQTGLVDTNSISEDELLTTLDLSGKTVTYGLASDDLPSGTVIQMVFDTYAASEQSTSSDTWQRVTGHTLDLTFKTANSRILIGNSAPGASRGAAVSFNLFAEHNGNGTWYNLATSTTNSALGISNSSYGLGTVWDTTSSDTWNTIATFWGGNLPFTHAAGDTIKVQPARRRGGPGDDSENSGGSYGYSHANYTNQLWMMEISI